MADVIGHIPHEGLTVRVERYSADDWEDHVIHIWDTVAGVDGLAEGILAIDGTVLHRPAITLSEWEALELIELLAKAVRRI